VVITRGFTGRPRRGRLPGDLGRRLPPGQYDAGDEWPVLTAEATPHLVPEQHTLTVDGAVDQPHTWTWHDLHTLPGSSYAGAIHCVTTWSRFGTTFTGVSLDELWRVVRPRPEAAYLLAHATTGYTTNLPLEDVTGEKAWVVWAADGRPLPPDHGGPLRLLVPHLYFWKSAKWVTRLELLTTDRPGFWEQNGYHDRGDPWLEQRYQGDP